MRLTLERSEAEIQREILRAVNLIPGIVMWRTNSRVLRMPGRGGRDRLVRFGGMKGISDLIGWRTGRAMFEPGQGAPDARIGRLAQFVAIEVKRPGGHVTIEQAAFLNSVRVAGGIAGVATSAEDAVKMLQ